MPVRIFGICGFLIALLAVVTFAPAHADDLAPGTYPGQPNYYDAVPGQISVPLTARLKLIRSLRNYISSLTGTDDILMESAIIWKRASGGEEGLVVCGNSSVNGQDKYWAASAGDDGARLHFIQSEDDFEASGCKTPNGTVLFDLDS